MSHRVLARTTAIVLSVLVTAGLLGGIARIAAAQHATALAAQAASSAHALAAGRACLGSV
jgi:hypothetical protein